MKHRIRDDASVDDGNKKQDSEKPLVSFVPNLARIESEGAYEKRRRDLCGPPEGFID